VEREFGVEETSLQNFEAMTLDYHRPPSATLESLEPLQRATRSGRVHGHGSYTSCRSRVNC
jgi:hypothetical protein